MNADDYLDRLRGQLKNFLPEQQADILAEIATHLESGEQDETRGADADARQAHVVAEMGSPRDMGDGFQAVYQPNRWLDFLLIFVPLYVVYPLLKVGYNFLTNGPIYYDNALFLAFSIRVAIVLGLVMLIVAQRRRSLLLFAFWSSDAITRLIALISREALPAADLTTRPAAVLHSVLGWALLCGLAYWLTRVLWKHRANLLIVLFALQPLIGSLAGYITTTYALTAGVAPQYPYWTVAGFSAQGLLEIVSLAGFVLLRSRDLRWVALLLGMGNYSMMMAYAYWPHLLPVAVWMLYSAIMLLLWIIDLRQRGRLAYE
ncbi:MAG TPA: hypothetical protein VIO36_08730 [Anaerolineaceae bacterium]